MPIEFNFARRNQDSRQGPSGRQRADQEAERLRNGEWRTPAESVRIVPSALSGSSHHVVHSAQQFNNEPTAAQLLARTGGTTLTRIVPSSQARPVFPQRMDVPPPPVSTFAIQFPQLQPQTTGPPPGFGQPPGWRVSSDV